MSRPTKNCSTPLGSTIVRRPENAEAFTLELFSSAALTHVLAIGCETGLLDRLSESWTTSERLAAATGVSERYTREWLGAVVCGRIVEYDRSAKAYRLSEWLSNYLVAKQPSELFRQSTMICHYASLSSQVVAAMRRGGGVPYSAYGERFYSIITEIWKPVYERYLLDGFLDQDEGIIEKLKAGVSVLEIGCGRGVALKQLAETFRNSRFLGIELSEDSVAFANEATTRQPNVFYRSGDVHEEDFHDYDIVMAFDTIHDLRDPSGVLRRIATTLRVDGYFVLVEFNLSSFLEKNLENPFSVLYYTFSLMHCIPVSLSNDGPGLGATWGVEQTTEMLRSSGFQEVSFLPTPRAQNCLYVCRVANRSRAGRDAQSQLGI